MSQIYYVYEWYIVDTNEVIYVGKGKNKRAWQLKENQFFLKMYNTHKCDVRLLFKNLSEEKAFEKEKELIKFYREKTNYRLTNILEGGNQPPSTLGLKHKKETKLKIANSNKIAYQNKDLKNQVSNRMKQFYSTAYGKEVASKRAKKIMNNQLIRSKISQSNKIYFQNDDNKKKKSEQMKKCYNIQNANKAHEKEIIQLDINGNYINIYGNLIEANKKTNISFKSISKVLRGKNKTAGGYRWIYKEDYHNTKEINPILHKFCKKLYVLPLKKYLIQL